ncbi:hypothetical protein BOX15_Mlig026044g2 [Macrostomum lignano]|uniref:Transglutaminase-like domain-containing protein n=2 Tax=Macrostomum lignano TaxID=282301 RepID=A0A267GKH6_9PLAT|nr:hypothetical protein BOX15_Mlig026044g2 [Macrostomum lignano]
MLPQNSYYSDYRYAPDEIPLEEFVLPTSPSELAGALADCGIPTPDRLQQLQRSRGQPPLTSPTSAQQKPQPFPPSRLKSELLEPARYEAGLARIRTLDLQSGSDLAGLCRRLFADCPEDLDRTVAAFGLVCRLAERPRELHRLPCLADRAAGRPDWQSEVFEAVMSLSGVLCQRLEGLKKGANYATGHRSHVGGAWFACFVDGEWRHVDAIWGSAGLPLAADAEASEAAVAAAAVPQRNDFFFLTDPARLAFSHHPLLPEGAGPDWQLLARPLSLDEFHRLPAYFDGNRAAMGVCGLRPVNCPLCVIPCQGGVADLLLQETVAGRYRYIVQAEQVGSRNSGSTPVAGAAVSKPIRLASGRVCLKFLAPLAGRFELRVGVQRGPDWLTEHFAAYVVHCPAAAPEPANFPAGQLAEFGLTEEAELEGVQLMGCQPEEAEAATLEAEDGEAAWLLTSTNPLGDNPDAPLPCCVTFGGDVDSPTDTGDGLKRHVLQWSERAGRDRRFRFLAPRSGWFAVTIWRDAARLRPLCELLLVADTAASGAHLGLPGCDSLLGWPANVDNQQQRRLGRRRLTDEIQLKSPTLPGGGGEPCLSLRHEAELTLLFRTQGRYVARAILQRLRPGDLLAEPLSSFVMVNGAPEGFQVHIRFPSRATTCSTSGFCHDAKKSTPARMWRRRRRRRWNSRCACSCCAHCAPRWSRRPPSRKSSMRPRPATSSCLSR